MSQHTIRCRKTRKALAIKIGGGWCVCPDGQCSEESYDQHLRETADFFTPGDKPPPSHHGLARPNDTLDYTLIDQWINTVGKRADVQGFQFNYAEGWRCACVAIRCLMDDHKRVTAGPHQPNPVHITPEQIKYMADRFLWWKLPADFSPDAGISFKAAFNEHTAHPMKHEPTGTNLFDATQVYAMVQYMVAGGMPPSPG